MKKIATLTACFLLLALLSVSVFADIIAEPPGWWEQLHTEHDGDPADIETEELPDEEEVKSEQTDAEEALEPGESETVPSRDKENPSVSDDSPKIVTILALSLAVCAAAILVYAILEKKKKTARSSQTAEGGTPSLT